MDRIGRYKIVRELGRGAMGVVYHAIDPNIGRPVAIKTIELSARKPEERERLRERLFREARSSGILSHPGIVTIYDVEQDGELAYIAMEFVDGPTLDQLLSAPQPIEPNRMLGILAQTASALDFAHSKGIVHRDIKPANIMIAADGAAKITDFGIAKITASEQFTMTGSIVGTPHYMSPEQVQGQAVDGRSDEFSLAVIAYEMLTGEKPYTGEHLTTVVYRIVAEEPLSPYRINSTLSGPIDNVLRKALSKRPDARYRTCSEFMDALEKACAATKNWKALPRGGSLNAPTMADACSALNQAGNQAGKSAAKPAVPLPPGRPPVRAGSATATTEVRRRKSNFLPFLAAILMAAAVLALIGWQAGPWGQHQSEPDKAPQTAESKPQPAAPPPDAPPSSQPSGDGKPSAFAGTPAPTGAVTDEKPPQQTAAVKPETTPQPAAEPEDIPKPPAKPQPDAPLRKAPPANPPRSGSTSPSTSPSSSPSGSPSGSQGTPQGVMVITSPSGATAILDGHLDQACTTPCTIQTTAGHHAISFNLSGYQIEHRDVTIGSGALELPAVILHAFSGVLMLSSTPPGASILVNGKPVTETTPAQLALPPGSYKIAVQKDGLQSVSTVEIHNGDTKILKLTLGQ